MCNIHTWPTTCDHLMLLRTVPLLLLFVSTASLSTASSPTRSSPPAPPFPLYNYKHSIYVDPTSPNATDESSTCWEGGPAYPCLTLNHALSGVHYWINGVGIYLVGNVSEYSLTREGGGEGGGGGGGRGGRGGGGEGGGGGGGYKSNGSYPLVFERVSTIGLFGGTEDSPRAVVIRCERDAGLTFVHSFDILFSDVSFDSCGVVHNSTSYSTSNSTQYERFRVGLYFLFCKDVSFLRVSVTNSLGTGLVMYGVVGLNFIQESRFVNNSFRPTDPYSKGGGVAIEMPYCDPTNNTCLLNSSSAPYVSDFYTSNATYVISRSEFSSNLANSSNWGTSLFYPHYEVHHGLGKGAGLSLILKGSASGNTVLIDECYFGRNRAITGGGMNFEAQDSSHNNSLSVTNSLFDVNHCYHHEDAPSAGSGGGGFCSKVTRYQSEIHDTSILLRNCTFKKNRAFWGGGVAFHGSKEHNVILSTNSLQFINCTWEQNLATIGSAGQLARVSLGNESGVPVIPVFTNCSFLANVHMQYIESGYRGMGTLIIDRLPSQLKGEVCFKDNTESGLVILGETVEIVEGTVVTFRNNTARRGAGILMYGHSSILLNRNVKLFFVENHAYMTGGAIHSDFVAEYLGLYGSCFIRYVDIAVPQPQWEVEVHFWNNTKKELGFLLPSAIMVTSLTSCTEGYSLPLSELFCYPQWDYGGEKEERNDCSNFISTYASRFEAHSPLSVTPGKKEKMNLLVYDEKGTNMDQTVINIWPLNTTLAAVNTSYIADDMILLYGEPNTSAIMTAQTLDPRVISTEMEVRLVDCPPGFVTSGIGNQTTCVCEKYQGAVRCENNFSASIQREYWMGPYDLNGTTVMLVGVSFVARNRALQRMPYINMPSDRKQLDELLCSHAGRTGVLCGQCLQNMSLDFVRGTLDCIECTDRATAYYSWILLILMKFVPLTLLCIVIVMLNISLTKGPANSFVFFAQMASTSFDIDGNGSIPISSVSEVVGVLRKGINTVYGIFILNFCQYFFPSVCLSTDSSTLGLLSIDYTVALFPLVFALMVHVLYWLHDRGNRAVVLFCGPLRYLFARFRRKWNVERSILDAYTTFIALSYIKFTNVSLNIVHPEFLQDENGTVRATVVYYNGSMRYFDYNHAPFFLIAVLTLSVFALILPLLLLFYPLKVLRAVSCHSKTCMSCEGKCRLFLLKFQGHFKDGSVRGTHDCRFFAGLYFVFRFVFLLVDAVVDMPFTRYLTLQVVCVVAVLLFATARPYKRDRYNNLDVAMFSTLAVINMLNWCVRYMGHPHTARLKN